jgi:hypothetical protein
VVYNNCENGIKNMKRLLLWLIAYCSLLIACAQAQNWTTVSASNITDLNQQKLAGGTICFLGTNSSDVPISFQVGGGGQVLARPFCVAVTNGTSAALTVPNPANTQPAGIVYRVTVTDSSSGQRVLYYKGVAFTGGTFSFDGYTPPYGPFNFFFIPGTSSCANDTNVTCNLNILAGTLTLGYTGTLAIGRGGLASGSLTAHDVILGEASAPNFIGGTTGQVLTSGNSADPAFSSYPAMLVNSSYSGTSPFGPNNLFTAPSDGLYAFLWDYNLTACPSCTTGGPVVSYTDINGSALQFSFGGVAVGDHPILFYLPIKGGTTPSYAVGSTGGTATFNGLFRVLY